VFDKMLINGLVPNMCTFEIYISGLAKKGDADKMIKTVKCMERTGFNANVQNHNMMIGEYMHSGEISRARELIDEMVRKGNRISHTNVKLQTKKVLVLFNLQFVICSLAIFIMGLSFTKRR